jgi:squalene-associated FAD-dependent desaturase
MLQQPLEQALGNHHIRRFLNSRIIPALKIAAMFFDNQQVRNLLQRRLHIFIRRRATAPQHLIHLHNQTGKLPQPFELLVADNNLQKLPGRRHRAVGFLKGRALAVEQQLMKIQQIQPHRFQPLARLFFHPLIIARYWILPSVIIVGGGLAGLSAAAALGGAGWQVDLFEARGFLGGRATSWPVTPSDEASEVIDNCQHVLLRCCHNLLDFYRRLGVADKVHFSPEYYFLEPGGHLSTLRRGALPPPFHFARSFAALKFLGAIDKAAIARAMLAIPKDRKRTDLDRIAMLAWLREKAQTPRAIERYWAPVLVSAVNEDVDRMAASHGLQVFWLGMLSGRDNYELGIPEVPLRELYREDAWRKIGPVHIHTRTPATIEIADGQVTGVRTGGSLHQAGHYISAVPFERIAQTAPGLTLDTTAFEHSPITGIHLWFDRPITQLPHAALLDRTIQWMFNKSGGRYVQLVVSASRSLTEMPRAEVIALALRELSEFIPAVRAATLERAHVVKEIRATFSARPGLEALRPLSQSAVPNLALAGDWTRTGWPATMEGAVRSGYLAAECVSRGRFLIPDGA